MLLNLPRSSKRLLALAIDSAICVWTVWAAFYLRLEEWGTFSGNEWLAVLVALPLSIAIFIRAGLYRAIFRHAGGAALLNVLRACLIYGASYSLIFTFVSVPGVPRTVGLIQPVLLLLAISASRAAAHYLLSGDYQRTRAANGNGTPVIIYGAGLSGRQLAVAASKDPSIDVVGFVDDDASLHGATVNGLMIFPPHRLAELIKRHKVTDVLLAIPSASRRRRREIVEHIRAFPVQIRVLPGWIDLAQGRVKISELRTLQIEDLLGRAPVHPDRALMEKNISGKTVAVSGAGGSIGGELCRQILEVGPAVLLLIESSEFALYSIHRELEDLKREHERDIQLVPFLASVLDDCRVRCLFERWRPETIYHAAAYKHVPLIEHNVLEGVRNNVFGTDCLADLAIEFEVKDFVLISTDKAVRPTNVMGASKRLAEQVLQARAALRPVTCFSMVRFGNVLGSSGSVVPLFRQQIAAGGPVTLTDAEMTRYFMTIPEAAQLVIQAGAMASGGEVFVLDMGQPVKIHDLAVNMIELSGLTVRDEAHPDGDIEIKLVGLRPGEKLYEELLIGDSPMATRHERILQAREPYLEWAELESQLQAIRNAMDWHDVGQVLAGLKLLVPGFRVQSETVDFIGTPNSPAVNRPRKLALRRLASSAQRA